MTGIPETKQAILDAIAEDGSRSSWTQDQWHTWLLEPSGHYREHHVTDATILGLFGIDRGDAILTAFETLAESDSKTKRVLSLLTDRAVGINLGHDDGQSFLDSVVSGGVITQQESDQLTSQLIEKPRWEYLGCRGDIQHIRWALSDISQS